MRLQRSDLQPYEAAAREACTRLNEHPDELVNGGFGSGIHVPRWLEMAARMRELHVMQTAMAERGPWGPA